MMQLGNHLQNLEAEKQKLRTQVKRLCQENAWLRDELASSQKKLYDCEQTNASYSVELEHLKFLKDIKQYDVNDNNSTTNNNSSSTNPTSGQTTDIVNDLFPNEDEIYMDQQDLSGGNQSKRFDSYADLAHSASASFISSTGYEIPARLKTLHNLVIQYASQGRYEVAVPLCRQALEDLEKTSGHQRKIQFDLLLRRHHSHSLFRSRCCDNVKYSCIGLS
jgi:kinesin light chain